MEIVRRGDPDADAQPRAGQSSALHCARGWLRSARRSTGLSDRLRRSVQRQQMPCGFRLGMVGRERPPRSGCSWAVGRKKAFSVCRPEPDSQLTASSSQNPDGFRMAGFGPRASQAERPAWGRPQMFHDDSQSIGTSISQKSYLSAGGADWGLDALAGLLSLSRHV